jgi:hypothetical protein
VGHVDLVADVLLAAGLAGFTAGGAARGWRRLAPLLCGIVPFAVELPGFIAFGDSTALHYFIACTWTAWLILFTALWSQSRRPAADLTTLPMSATAASQARN